MSKQTQDLFTPPGAMLEAARGETASHTGAYARPLRKDRTEKEAIAHIKDCAEAYPTLYSITGKVVDNNTMLVPRDELWALIACFHTSPLGVR